MTPDDVSYLRRILHAGLIQSPCLELGVGYSGPNNKDLIKSAAIEYAGTDVHSAADVDYVVDFEQRSTTVRNSFPPGTSFGSAIVFNVLEHTFDPIRVLDNVFDMLRPNGTCVIITPTVWPLHNFPSDCWRINPNFYEEYARRHGLTLLDNTFEYVQKGKVKDQVDSGGAYALPKPGDKTSWRTYSRVIHRLFDTYGRQMFFPSHIATGVVIKKTMP